MDLNLPAIEKLLDYAASGIGSVAGSVLAPWKARREAQAKQITAEGDATILQIQAEAQSKAREILVSRNTDVTGELDITDKVNQRIQFQEQKRQINIGSVVKEAASQLGDKRVANIEPDHDWTARFFNEVQDVSSEELQSLWAKVLAGEVERAGSTSVRSLGILKNLDQDTARLFSRFCSACMYMSFAENVIIDARIPSLGGNAGNNSLQKYGLNFSELNRLNEHGLIISDYNSWKDYRNAIGIAIDKTPQLIRIPFSFQNRYWVLVPTSQHDWNKEFKLHGVALTKSGEELSRIVGLEPMEEFVRDLIKYFHNKNLQMTEVNSSQPQLINDYI